MPQPMMRSTDTSQGWPYCAAGPGARGQHALGAARVHHQRRARAVCGEPAIERRDDAAALAEAAVFGRQHELDAEAAKEVEIEELGAALRAP